MTAPRSVADEMREALRGFVPSSVPATLSANAIVLLSARLRMACAALGVKPEDVRLDDLAEDQRQRLLREGQADFWKIIHNDEGTETT